MSRRREREDYGLEPEEAPIVERERKRAELKDIRTAQAPVVDTSYDEIERLRERKAPRSGASRPSGGDPYVPPAHEIEQRQRERESYSEVKVVEPKKVVDTSYMRAGPLDEEPYPMPTHKAPTPEFVEDIGRGVAAIETGFRQVSGGLRETARGLREKGKAKREPLPDPGEIVGLPGPGQRPRPGGVEEMTGLVIRAGASAFDAFTMPVRPILVAETIDTMVKLVVDAPTRKAFLKSAAEDPAGFGADILGGAVGGYALGRGIGKVRQVYTRRRYLTDLPDEAFYAEDGIPDPRIPRPVDVERLTVVGKESVRVVDDLGAGFLDSHQVKVGTLPTQGTKTLDLRMGRESFSNWEEFAKGYYRTGHDLIPGLVPKGVGKIKTVYRFGLEYGTAFRPAVRLPLRPRIMPPGAAPLALTTGLGVLSSFKAEPSFRPPEEALAVEEEVRVMTGRSTVQRRRPKPTEPGFIEVPTVIEFGGHVEKERDLIAPLYRPRLVERPPKLRRRQRYRPVEIVDQIQETTQRVREEIMFSIPHPPRSTYRDPRPVYRPEMAKSALKRGRGSWRWFGEYRQYLKGDPLKVLDF